MGSPWRKTSLLAVFFGERFMEAGLKQCSEEEESFRNGRNATRQAGSHRQRHRGESDPGPETFWVWGEWSVLSSATKVPPTVAPCWKGNCCHFSHLPPEGITWGLLLKQSLSPCCWQFLEVVGETRNRNGIHPPWCPQPQVKLGLWENAPSGLLAATSEELTHWEHTFCFSFRSTTIRKPICWSGSPFSLCWDAEIGSKPEDHTREWLRRAQAPSGPVS